MPRTNNGAGDFPRADVLVTLGAFLDVNGKPVGTPFMQASTLMHEMGHHLERRHGGEALEPNCKPTHLSVMDYLYQLRGLLDNSGKPNLDFSDGSLAAAVVDEDDLVEWDTVAGLPDYRIGWYAPYSGSYLFGRPGVKIAASHSDGSVIEDGAEFVRIEQRSTASFVDWNANGVKDGGEDYTLDVNFNGRIDGMPNPPAEYVLKDAAAAAGARAAGTHRGTPRRSAARPRGCAHLARARGRRLHPETRAAPS